MNLEFNTIALLQALSLAESERGFCAPNPAVGAVIAKDNKILATGVHLGSGKPHAEIEALSLLENRAHGASLYVTLEPCCHFGKTPPCTDQIIKSGIREVYYGLKDPNPKVAGKGISQLENAGIHCQLMPLNEIADFYQSYRFWLQHQMPFVTAKIALSLDGKIAGLHGHPVSITGKLLQQETHAWRKKSDALLTTINTVINDDPQFNVRLNHTEIKKTVYVLDSKLRFPLTAKLINTAKKLIILHGDQIDEQKKSALSKLGVECQAIATNRQGLALSAVLNHIGKDGVHDLWVEAGGTLFQALLLQRLTQRTLFYVAPKILGSRALSAFSEAVPLLAETTDIHWRTVGSDVVLTLNRLTS